MYLFAVLGIIDNKHILKMKYLFVDFTTCFSNWAVKIAKSFFSQFMRFILQV